jgi:hypothetical protein
MGKEGGMHCSSSMAQVLIKQDCEQQNKHIGFLL